MRRRSLFPWLAALFAFVAGIYGMAEYSVRAGADLPLFSSRRYDPYGTAALREVMREKNIQSFSFERKIPPDTGDASYMMILPMDWKDNDERRRKRLLDWAEKGNRLIVLSRKIPFWLAGPVGHGGPQGDTYFEMLTVEEEQKKGNYQYQQLSEFVETASGETIAVFGSGIFEADGSVDVLAGDADNALAVLAPYGNGQIVYIADPTVALNYALSHDDNLPFLLSLIGNGPVYFDEYSLGLGVDESMLGWLRELGFGPFLLQLLLALYLFGASAQRELASDTPLAAPGDNPAEEQVAVLAGIYNQTFTPKELTRLYDECAACHRED